MKKPESKKRRHDAITEIVGHQEIKTHEQLLNELEIGYGIHVVQSVISRDLKDLRIKLDNDGFYALPEVLQEEKRRKDMQSVMDTHCLRVNTDVRVVAVKAYPGYAQPLAMEIENYWSTGVVGTIAGHDTALIIVENDQAGESVIEEIYHMAGSDKIPQK